MKPPEKPFSKRPILYKPLNLGIYTTLVENILAISPSPLAEFAPSIDRMQITIRNKNNATYILNDILSSTFDFNRTVKVKDRMIWRYYFEDSLIQLMKVTDYWKWSGGWLIISDPSESLQEEIKTILKKLNTDAPTDINLQQVEFAYDFYPYDESDLDDIRLAVERRLVSRNLRAGGCIWRWKTHYQAPKGDLRSGPGGTRLYPKEEPGQSCLRLELQLNSDRLNSKNINLKSLPITPDMIDPMYYLSFRESLGKEWLEKIANAGFKKHYPKEIYKFSPSMERRMKSIYKRRVLGSFFKEEIPIWGLASTKILDETAMTTLMEIDRFKEIREKWGLTYQPCVVFPNINLQPPDFLEQLLMFEDEE